MHLSLNDPHDRTSVWAETTAQSSPRRSLPQPNVGNIAINDAFMLEAAIYHLLKKHFRQEPYYVDLLELFLEVSLSWAQVCNANVRPPSKRKWAS